MCPVHFYFRQPLHVNAGMAQDIRKCISVRKPLDFTYSFQQPMLSEQTLHSSSTVHCI